MAVRVEAKTVELLDPAGVAQVKSFSQAPGLGDLKGKVIGIIDNHKPNADILLGRLAELLTQRYPGVKIVTRRKVSPPTPGPVDEMAALCDAVIVGTGD